MNNKKHILSPEERRMIYIDYLKKNNGASTSEFLTYLKEKYNVTISRGTLCEDRESLTKMNYKFTCQKRKYFLTIQFRNSPHALIGIFFSTGFCLLKD